MCFLKMDAVINMTPHDVNIINNEGTIIKIYPSSGKTIRLSSETIKTGFLDDGTPLTITKFGEPTELPKYQPNTYFIVSQIVKNALTSRNDLLVPAEVVRDDKGNIIGCKSLGQ
jgi:hypothetical protein